MAAPERPYTEIKSGDVLTLPRLLDEDQVAEALGCSPDTVRRERKRRRLGFTRIGGRIRYAEDQVAAYLSNQREDPCERDRTGSAKSADSGLAGEQIAPSGVEHGSTAQLDKLAVHRSAQRILTTPSSSSPRGGWRTARWSASA